jgi:hypothetical protein
MSDDPVAETLLEAMANLSRSHREHEKFYGAAPRETAVALQRHARTLEALADRWTRVDPRRTAPLSPFEGADDLNADAALQLDGVLFMEGEGRPAELTRLVADLRRDAEGFAATGEWLANAMQASWDLAASLIDIDGLADLLGERHRIIANDWHAAGIASLVARLLVRAADIIEHVDLTPAVVRADLATARRSPQLLYAAAELINHAADLSSDSAGLVNDNERRWRTFRARVVQLTVADGGHRLGG